MVILSQSEIEGHVTRKGHKDWAGKAVTNVFSHPVLEIKSHESQV